MARFNQTNAALRICVDGAGSGQLSGRILSQMLTMPLPFSDVAQLLLQIETLLDVQNFPQAFHRARTFASQQRDTSFAANTPEEGIGAQEVAAAAGEVATITVHILSRRSSTWQGRISWEDGEPPQPFASALEFMHLIDTRLQDR